MFEQLGHGVETVRDGAGRTVPIRFLPLALLPDKAAADGVVHLADSAAVGPLDGKAHAVRVLGQRFGLVEQQAGGHPERYPMAAQQRQFARRLGRGQHGVDPGGLHALRRLAHQAQDDGLVGGVAHARQGQRTIQRRFDGHHVVQRTAFDQEAARSHHRPHGVGTGWPDADLKQVKYAHVHRLSRFVLYYLYCFATDPCQAALPRLTSTLASMSSTICSMPIRAVQPQSAVAALSSRLLGQVSAMAWRLSGL